MMIVMTNDRKNVINRPFCNVVLTLLKALFTLDVITLTTCSHVPVL